jgi:hypothetical protein
MKIFFPPPIGDRTDGCIDIFVALPFISSCEADWLENAISTANPIRRQSHPAMKKSRAEC